LAAVAALAQVPSGLNREGGGDRGSQRIEAEAVFILGAAAELPDMTLAELTGKLGERGMSVRIATLRHFFPCHGIPTTQLCEMTTDLVSVYKKISSN
jgi:hypothetical protein